MSQKYKFKPEIARFIVSRKHKNPEISCRKLALECSKKFKTKFSKSSINNILKNEKLSSPVGRRSKVLISLEGKIEHAGFSMLQALNHHLEISKTAAEVLVELSPSAPKSLQKDVENIIQGLVIYKLISGATCDFSVCYSNKEIWSLVGRRPTKTVYNRIIKMIQNSQPFSLEIVREINRRLSPISGFRFQLADNSSFFVDAVFQSIWRSPLTNNQFFTTYYKATSYINEFLNQERIFSVFNIQETSIFSPDILNFILSFNYQDVSKRIKQIELLDSENHIVENKLIFDSEKRFFLLGFWPWQLEIMSEFERRPAKQKLVWDELGVEYYYQIEEVSIPQHLVPQEVKLIALILRKSPLGAATIGILTNFPKDVISNILSYKKLYHWSTPQERYKDFIKKTKAAAPKNLFHLPESQVFSTEDIGDKKRSLDGILEMLGEIILRQFQHGFLPNECSSWEPLKIKEVFLKQKATINRSKDFLIHNFFIDKQLCKEAHFNYICHRLNESGIRDSQDRLMWFK